MARHDSPAWHALRATHERARGWLRRRGVVGIGIGAQRVRGEATGETALVVYVEEKLPHDALSATRRLPSRVRVGKRWLPVDVQVAGARARVQPHGVAGSALRLPGDSRTEGTLGAFVRSGGEVLALTAAHVVGAPAHALVCSAGGLDPCRVIRPPKSDAALLRPSFAVTPVIARFPSNLPVHGIATVSDALLHRPAFFSPGGTGMVQTVVRDVHLSAPVENTTMHGLVAVDPCSQHGDSGGLVVDESGNALGVVMGAFAGHTILAPLDRLAEAEGLEMFV